VRRTLAGFTAFLAMTGTFVILPVYADPGPVARPVEPAIEEVALGSVAEPEGEAVVTTDGEPDGSATSSAPSAAPPPSPSATPTTEAAPTSEVPADTQTSEDVASSGSELPGVPALTVSQPDTDQFSSVGVTWAQGEVDDVVVQLRVKDADGDWGTWTTLDADDVEQTPSPATPEDDARGGTAPYWTGEAHGIEVIVQGAGGAVPDDVKVALIDPGESPADSLTRPAAATDEAHAGDAMPPVYSRAQWGADESIRTWDPEYASTLKAATLHHTADRNTYTADEVPAIMRSIYAYHTLTREWGDIGYNVIVDRFGRMFEGRAGGLSSTVIGAHAGGFNTYTFGVSMLGNYDLVPVPQAVVNSVSEIIAWKFGLYNVPARGTTTLISGGGGTSRTVAGTAVSLPTIFGHRDVGSTACPGQYGYARLNEIRDRVAAAAPRYVRTTTVRDDASTGFVPDWSPVHVSAVTAPNGMSTVFVRGTNNTVWYRTAQSGGSWTPYTGVPATGASSGPSVTVTGGNRVHLVVRGLSNDVWYNTAPLLGDGRPGTWAGWQPLGGYATAAPTIASLAPDRLAVVTRGLDGSVWQRTWNGSAWAPWASLGGDAAYSAAVVQADAANSRYLVTVVRADSKIWQVGAGIVTPGPQGPWVGGGVYSSHSVGTNGASASSGATTLLSTGGSDHSAVLFDPATGGRAGLGGVVTSIAGMTRQPDGSTLVLGRGLDDALWVLKYRPGQTATWTSLGGIIQ
jgi:N-acetylmuramoyl-L-alanine amidase